MVWWAIEKSKVALRSVYVSPNAFGSALLAAAKVIIQNWPYSHTQKLSAVPGSFHVKS